MSREGDSIEQGQVIEMAGKKAVVSKDAPKGYTEQGGAVNAWEAGEVVEGFFLGLTAARNEDSSPVIRIQTVEGLVRYWTPTILESKLADVEPGTAVIIECLGKTAPIKSRKTIAWDFKVYTKNN
jgi:hypothetical protein